MPDVKGTIKQIQLITYGAYGVSGQVAALLEEPDSRPEAVAKALENTAARLERGAVELRAICESSMPPVSSIGQKPALPPLDIAGQVERRRIYCTTIIVCKVKVLIPETEMWVPGEVRLSHVLRNMSGAEIDYVILAVVEYDYDRSLIFGRILSKL